MTLSLFFEQVVNGLQYGVFLFLVSAGLTLVFGIMNFINLAHGVLFMIGAYCASAVYVFSGSFYWALAAAPLLTAFFGFLLERTLLQWVYGRDHLDQVMITFGILIFLNQFVVTLFGGAAQPLDVPKALGSYVNILAGTPYPTFRLAIIVVGVLVAVLCYWVVARTRVGALVRAGASNRIMLGILGINVDVIYSGVFCVGAGLAGLAGVMAGPIISVGPGMGDDILIMAFVVIVIGGIGSIRGALVASILVGLVEVLGRTVFKVLLSDVLGSVASQTAAPAVASILTYVLMITVLFLKPSGLFSGRTG